ncbi:hypothetical protein N7457_000937 [Penicillium paradoxum]|uniref:uncharacterized protein n=1 Tax=Penicillium paradoxum TaxID=176176 RepID=UPI002547555F|nr:uncharacterized protein N7457_000937 [Penicillium paradoxum]KAJ5794338.1 hypothetical protein N7457_000937 [Penicillium paradoxum]
MSNSNTTNFNPESSESTRIIQSQPFRPRPPITTEERIAVFKRLLDPNDSLYTPSQLNNVTAVVHLYQQGNITVDDEIFVVDGHIASEEECIAAKNPYFWEAS